MRVIGLGAICDLDPDAVDDGREHSFRISEFALLENGDRVILHSERGYAGRISTGNIWAHATAESITRDVLTAVLPDSDDSVDEHPWHWLADLAQARNVDVTADDLRLLPYEVVLTENVTARLSNEGPVQLRQRMGMTKRAEDIDPESGCTL